MTGRYFIRSLLKVELGGGKAIVQVEISLAVGMCAGCRASSLVTFFIVKAWKREWELRWKEMDGVVVYMLNSMMGNMVGELFAAM